MSTKKKILITLILIVFVGASVAMSFNIVARSTFEFTYVDSLGGYEFDGFNGNTNTTKVTLDHFLEKQKVNGEETWVPVEDKYIVSVDSYTIISDEYVEEIFIGSKVQNIDERAFVYCKKLKAIHVDENNPYYTDVDGVLFTKDMKTLLCYPLCREVDGEVADSYTVPSSVNRIADMSFYKCINLKNVTINEGVTYIGEMTFFKCENLSLVTLPNTLTFLGTDAFSYCYNMKYAMFIPASVNEIRHHCFYKCDNLEKFFVGCSENDITLGGKWMPKSENSFASDEAIFGATFEDFKEYNDKRIEENYVPPVETAEGEEASQKSEEVFGGMNKTAVILLIAFVFVPGIASVAVDVIRNLFKDDFLMTKRGKKKLAIRKAEKERIHQAYVNGEYSEESSEQPIESSEGKGDDE